MSDYSRHYNRYSIRLYPRKVNRSRHHFPFSAVLPKMSKTEYFLKFLRHFSKNFCLYKKRSAPLGGTLFACFVILGKESVL